MNRNKTEVENFMDFNSDAIITIATRIAADNSKVEEYIKRMVTKNDCEFIYMHPIDDISLHNTYTQYIKYEAGSEEGVLALLSSFLLQDTKSKYSDFIDELDIGYLSGETSIGEEEFEDLVEQLANKKEITLIVGDDILGHKHLVNITNLIRLIDSMTSINVVLLNKNLAPDLSKEIQLNDVEDIQTYNGTVIYIVNSDEDILKGSNSFAMAAKIKDGDSVNITFGGKTVQKVFQVDLSVRGTIALYPILQENTNQSTVEEGYRFKQVKIEKVLKS